MTNHREPNVWPALQAHDPRAVIDFLLALGFEETSSHIDDTGVLSHAQLDWPEGGGVMLGPHRQQGPFTQQPGSSAAYVVTTDVDAVLRRAHQAGIEHPARPIEQDYGSRELTLRDVEGNQWIFGTYPGEPRVTPRLEQSLYEYAGGAPAMLAVAAAFHARCLADPLLEHPFSKPDQHPQHVERLAAYWTQMLGGESAYTDLGVDQSYLMRIHLGEGGANTPYRAAFVACFDAAVDDAGLPAEPDFRRALHDSQVWAADDLMPDHDDPARVPDGLMVPVWSWDGLLEG